MTIDSVLVFLRDLLFELASCQHLVKLGKKTFLCVCMCVAWIQTERRTQILNYCVPVNIFGFCKRLKGNIWQKFQNDRYENHF